MANGVIEVGNLLICEESIDYSFYEYGENYVDSYDGNGQIVESIHIYENEGGKLLEHLRHDKKYEHIKPFVYEIFYYSDNVEDTIEYRQYKLDIVNLFNRKSKYKYYIEEEIEDDMLMIRPRSGGGYWGIFRKSKIMDLNVFGHSFLGRCTNMSDFENGKCTIRGVYEDKYLVVVRFRGENYKFGRILLDAIRNTINNKIIHFNCETSNLSNGG